MIKIQNSEQIDVPTDVEINKELSSSVSIYFRYKKNSGKNCHFMWGWRIRRPKKPVKEPNQLESVL